MSTVCQHILKTIRHEKLRFVNIYADSSVNIAVNSHNVCVDQCIILNNAQNKRINITRLNYVRLRIIRKSKKSLTTSCKTPNSLCPEGIYINSNLLCGDFVFVFLDHLLNHLTANGAGFTGCEVAVVTLLKVYADFPWCSCSILKIGIFHPFCGTTSHATCERSRTGSSANSPMNLQKIRILWR